MTQLKVILGDPHHPEATALLQASHALMQSLFAEEDNHYLEISELCADDVRFFVATTAARTVGCIALANRGTYGEVKSLFVDPEARGLGAAAALMEAIEEEAKQQGLAELKLETGDSLTAAQRLYSKHGFDVCGPFGDYPDSAASVFMTKTISDS